MTFFRRFNVHQLPVVVAFAILSVGWVVVDFVCDDAYIAFRYVSNLRAGWGLTWNPPPFLPVEGYTSFLWVSILAAAWSATGVEPPEASVWISLFTSFGTLCFGHCFLTRMRLGKLESHRLLLTCLLLWGVASNRTFIVWTSSGLETGVFTLLFTWWVYEGLTRVELRDAWWAPRLSLAAALMTLTRPDGQLVCLATVSILVVDAWGRPRSARRVPPWSGAPLLAVVAHVLWRRATYGQWQPNTYTAKQVSPWPEAGVRYLGSFILEYGLWLWLLLVIFAAWVTLRRVLPRLQPVVEWGAQLWSSRSDWWPPVATSGAVLAHFAYYILIVGGDHFEYRIFHHLVLFLPLLLVWLQSLAGLRPVPVCVGLLAVVLVSLPISWGSWYLRRDVNLREARAGAPLADQFPAPLRPVVGSWDALQDWLHTKHLVGCRYYVHRLLPPTKLAFLPTRAEALKRYGWRENRQILTVGSVGVLGWQLPEVAIIDRFGLNDRVVARNPTHGRARDRKMAHERRPPEGYVECFHPNLRARRTRLQKLKGVRPASDEMIRSCEAANWD